MAIIGFNSGNESRLAEPQQSETKAYQRSRKIAAAMGFLREALDNGPRGAAEVEAEALAAGHAHSTLAEARKRLKIEAKRAGKGWEWVPPKTWRRTRVGKR